MEMKGKDRRTLQIMAAIYGAQATLNRGELSMEKAIQTSVAAAIITMNEVEKALTRQGNDG